MNLVQTVSTKRPKLSLHYGRTQRPSRERRMFQTSGTLSALELQRIVSEMVG